jgi:hypothetical protein
MTDQKTRPQVSIFVAQDEGDLLCAALAAAIQQARFKSDQAQSEIDNPSLFNPQPEFHKEERNRAESDGLLLQNMLNDLCEQLGQEPIEIWDPRPAQAEAEPASATTGPGEVNRPPSARPGAAATKA